MNELLSKTFKDPGDCARTITKNFWTTAELMERMVKPSVNSDKKQLSPEKVEKVTAVFSKWLRKKGYIKDARHIEIKRINSHMGRAIDNVHKQHKQKIKTTMSKRTSPVKKDLDSFGEETE